MVKLIFFFLIKHRKFSSCLSCVNLISDARQDIKWHNSKRNALNKYKSLSSDDIDETEVFCFIHKTKSTESDTLLSSTVMHTIAQKARNPWIDFVRSEITLLFRSVVIITLPSR